MIKVFRLSDLIKYFIKFIIPVIIIIICLNIFIKKGNNNNFTDETKKINNGNTISTNANTENSKEKEESKNKKFNKAYYFCLNSEIIDLKNIKDETKIDVFSLLKKIIQSEFGILNQSENVNNYNAQNNGNSGIQKIVEYSLGLTPIQFNNADDKNTYNTNPQDKNQSVDNLNKNIEDKNSKNSKEAQSNNETSSNDADNSNDGENPVKQAEENVKTEVVSNNVNPRYNYDYNGIKIYNSTKYKLTNEMLDTSNFSVNKNKILIYHTHTCESYTPTAKYNYQQTGNFRTTNLNFSVVRVGEELKKQLESYNIKVVQNKTYHDYPSYNGSYSRSLTTANNMLNENKDADIIIDLHRDAIADSSYAPKVKIGDEYVSQMMFVIGTDIANSANSHWNENLRFAVKVQQKANEMYPRTI